MRLWIDDLRNPPDGWWWAKTSADAIGAIECLPVQEVSFDHDLGGDDTAMSVARLIEERAHDGVRPPTWHIHSANPVGRKNLEAALKSADRFWDLCKSTNN